MRVKDLRRHEAMREIQHVTTRFGEVSVKLKRLDGKIVQANPKYEECLALAERLNLPMAEIYREVLAAAAALITI